MPRTPKNDAVLALRLWNASSALPRAREAAGLEPLLRVEGADVVRVRFRRTLDAGVARAVVLELAAPAAPPAVVVAERSTAAARRILEEHGVGVVDAAGHARLRLPGLVVRMDSAPVTPQERSPRIPRVADGRARGVRLRGRTGLVGQALLLWPGTSWQVQELAVRCGLSPSPVHFVLRRLEESGLVRTEGRGPGKTRHLVHREALLDLLAEEHGDRGVASVHGRWTPAGRSGEPGSTVEGVAAALAAAAVPHAVTGAAAFDRRSPSRPPERGTTIWVEHAASLPELLARVGVRPDPGGPGGDGGDGGRGDDSRRDDDRRDDDAATGAARVELRQVAGDAPLAFVRSSGGVAVANPVRVYLDLLGTPGGGRSRAALLRRALVGR